MMTQEIIKVLCELMIDSIQGKSFQSAYLNIEFASDVSALTGEYIDENGKLQDIELETDIKHFSAILQLKKETQSHPLKHKKWNRAKITLYPTGKFSIEFIWDEELQREVNKYNNEI